MSCLKGFSMSLSVRFQLSHKFPSKSITPSSQEVWGKERGEEGQRERRYIAAEKVKHSCTWVFPDSFSSHSFCHELTVKLGAKVHPLCKGSKAAWSGKNSSKSQHSSTHMHLHSLSLHTWKLRKSGPDPKPTERAHQLQQAPDQPEKTKCFSSDWEAYWFFLLHFFQASLKPQVWGKL